MPPLSFSTIDTDFTIVTTPSPHKPMSQLDFFLDHELPQMVAAAFSPMNETLHLLSQQMNLLSQQMTSLSQALVSRLDSASDLASEISSDSVTDSDSDSFADTDSDSVEASRVDIGTRVPRLSKPPPLAAVTYNVTAIIDDRCRSNSHKFIQPKTIEFLGLHVGTLAAFSVVVRNGDFVLYSPHRCKSKAVLHLFGAAANIPAWDTPVIVPFDPGPTASPFRTTVHTSFAPRPLRLSWYTSLRPFSPHTTTSLFNVDSNLLPILWKAPISNDKLAAYEFFLALSACHLLFPLLGAADFPEGGLRETNAYAYIASSSDVHRMFDEMPLSEHCYFSLQQWSFHSTQWDPGEINAPGKGFPPGDQVTIVALANSTGISPVALFPRQIVFPAMDFNYGTLLMVLSWSSNGSGCGRAPPFASGFNREAFLHEVLLRMTATEHVSSSSIKSNFLSNVVVHAFVFISGLVFITGNNCDGFIQLLSCSLQIERALASMLMRLFTTHPFGSLDVVATLTFDEQYDYHSQSDHDAHAPHIIATIVGSLVHGAHLLGYVSGSTREIAPGAGITSYIVRGTDRCFNSHILSLVDSAATVGVPILSISLGGELYYRHNLSLTVFSAMENGVFVSFSAGNAGPGPVRPPLVSPWIIAVGASVVDSNSHADDMLVQGRKVLVTALYNGLPATIVEEKEGKEIPHSVFTVAPGAHLSLVGSGLIGPSILPIVLWRVSGTSISWPHVSGIAALCTAKNPEWSPTAIKSGLMTTTYVQDITIKPLRVAFSTAPAISYDHSVGITNPSKALDPASICNTLPHDYLDYWCTQKLTTPELGIFARDSNRICMHSLASAGDLNYPVTTVCIAEQSLKECKLFTGLHEPNQVLFYSHTSLCNPVFQLVYAYIPQETVAGHFHDHRAQSDLLPWHIRMHVAIQIASVLLFLYVVAIIHIYVSSFGVVLLTLLSYTPGDALSQHTHEIYSSIQHWILLEFGNPTLVFESAPAHKKLIHPVAALTFSGLQRHHEIRPPRQALLDTLLVIQSIAVSKCQPQLMKLSKVDTEILKAWPNHNLEGKVVVEGWSNDTTLVNPIHASEDATQVVDTSMMDWPRRIKRSPRWLSDYQQPCDSLCMSQHRINLGSFSFPFGCNIPSHSLFHFHSVRRFSKLLEGIVRILGHLALDP